MKRLRLWLNELNLTQQLIGIVFLFVSVFVAFVFFFLNPAIERFSQTEMYELLHNSQNTMILYLNENADHQVEVPVNDSSIKVCLYDVNLDAFTPLVGSGINETGMISVQTQKRNWKEHRTILWNVLKQMRNLYLVPSSLFIP